MIEKNNEKKGEYLEAYGVIQDTDGTIRMPTKGFPVELFLEWNAHCVTRHNNCRWEKMFSDHEKARMFEAMVEKRLMEEGIPERVPEISNTPKKEKKVEFMGV